MTYPGVLFWLAAIWSMSSRGPGLYYLFFLSWSLGTLAVIPPQLAGGNFTPAWVVAGLLTVRVVMNNGLKVYLRALVDPRRFGLLSLSVFYAVISAIFFPRFFEGQVKVVEMRLLTTADPLPLRPSLANVNQTLYFILGALAVVDVYFICRRRATRDSFLVAFAWGALAAIGTGLLDLVTSKVGMGGLLAPFRNAAYVMMLDNDAMDMHRIVGLMSEASAYAGLCLPFLALLGLAPKAAGPWGRWSLPLAGGLALMTYLSTSSGGYVGLAVVGVALGASLGFGMAAGRRAAWLGGYGLLVAVTAAVGAALLTPKLIDTVYRVIDGMVLHKTQSDSYIQRSAWNTAAIAAFFGTHGLGVGAGSARASSWPIALLANIGLPGTLTLAAFIVQTLMVRARNPNDRLLGQAAKLALFPNLIMLSLSGTSISFGLGLALLLGLISSLAFEEAPVAQNSAPPPLLPGPRNRPKIVGVFIDEPLHAVVLSSHRSIETAPSSAPASAGPNSRIPQRSIGDLIDMIDEIENLENADRYLHLMVFGPAASAVFELDAWLSRHRRWSCEHVTRARVDTKSWLAGLSAATGGLMSTNGLRGSSAGARQRLIMSTTTATPEPKPRNAFISSDCQSTA